MKNLANCKPSEFLKQTNKIRKSVANWLELTKVMEIMGKKPDYVKAGVDATAEEKVQIIMKNKELLNKQTRDNWNEFLEAALDQYPDETLELLALMCFVEPDHVDDYPMSEYIGALTELINDKNVLSFFTSLMQLGQTATSSASNQ